MNTVNVPPHCGFNHVYRGTNHLISGLYGFVSENVDGKKGEKKHDEAGDEEDNGSEEEGSEEGGSEEGGSEDGMDEDLED